MYSFTPTNEQTMLIDWVSRFARDDLRPAAHDAEETRELPTDLIQTGWELGMLQASISEADGGFGDRSAVTSLLAAEELAFGDLAGALAIMTPGLFALPISMLGSPEQREAHLTDVLADRWPKVTAALLESQFDFDPQTLATRATPDGAGWLLNGHKTFVPYGAQADKLIVYAAIDGQTQAFIVPGDTEGLVWGAREDWLGLNALPTYALSLDNVRLSASDRLGGPEGHALQPLLNGMRVALAGLGLGVARAAYEYARDYAKERKAFGTEIAKKQAIAFMLAEMATEIEAMRLLAWEAAWTIDRDHTDSTKQAYLAHTGVADMAMMVSDRGVQILGGHGYIREHPAELWMRNGRAISNLLGVAMI
jgi:alkylation response protein AidB-like acyl-CoA dehydrogenase